MKTWTHKLSAHVAHWAGKKWPGDVAKCVYRVDPLENVASALARERLFSRAAMAGKDIQFTDCAARSVIEGTPAEHQEFVRLYFAPRTPTQFRSEGIRPAAQLYHGAHCPIPVILAFDLVQIIGREGTMFSNGNMGSSSVEWDDTEEFFDSIPFDLVYHRGSFGDELRQRGIVFHRNAEVLVPDELGLESLERIICRSAAERRTLLHHLDSDLADAIESFTEVEGRRFFCQDWAFVENVSLSDGSFEASLHLPHEMDVRWKYELENNSWSWRGKHSKSTLRINMRNLPAGGVVTMWIEDHLAFKDQVLPSDEPF